MSIARPTMAQTERQVRDLSTSAAAGGQQAQVLSYLQNKLAQLTMSGQAGTPEHFIIAGEIQALKNAAAKAQLPPANPRPVIADLLPAPLTPTPMPQTPAPEDAGGIAAMEAPNMETIDMMGGGLVAFEGGGEVPRYQNQGLVSDPFDRFFGDSQRPMPMRVRNAPSDLTPEEVEQAKKLGIFESFRFMAASPEEKRRMLDSLANQSAKALQTGNAVLPGAETRLGTLPSKQDMAAAAAQTRASMTPEGRAQYLKNLTGVDTGGIPAVGATATPGADNAQQGIGAMVKGPRSFESAYDEASRIAGKISPLTKTEVPSAAMAVQTEKDILSAAGFDANLYKNQIAEIRADAEKDKGRKDEAINMRLLEAGLGILAGESPYAFVNIGKGSLPAVKGLSEDIKELRKLEKERQKSMRDLAVAENQVAAGIGGKASERMENAQKRLDKQNEQEASLKSGIAKALFDADTSRYVADRAAETQRMVLDKEPSDVRTARAAMADPKLAEMLKKLSPYSSSAGIDQKLVLEYAKNPVKLQTLKSTDPAMYNYIVGEINKLRGVTGATGGSTLRFDAQGNPVK